MTDRDMLLRFGAAFAADGWSITDPNRPVWIALEGEDGVGKSTLAHYLKYRMSLDDRSVVVEAFGKHFIHDGLSQDELWRMFLNEFIVRQKDLHEAYERGFSIIQDRSFLSTMVYQEDYNATPNLMDAVYAQWAYMPTHIFILPPYGSYAHFRQVSRLVLPLTGRSINIVCVPEELNTVEEKAEFIWKVLRGEIQYTPQGVQNAEDTAESHQTDGSQGQHDGSGSGLEFDGFVRQATNDIAAALSSSPIHTNGTSADTADIQVSPPVPTEDNPVGTTKVSPIHTQEG